MPKTAKSKRTLTLGGLASRYAKWIAGLKRKGPNDWVFPQDEDLARPRWDSGVRKALKQAARSIKPEGADKHDPGLDFPGFGPHSFRRANITWRQEVGGSAIEASKIAGYSEVDMTGEYTFVGIDRQEALTRAIQERLAQAAPQDGGPASNDAQREQMAQARPSKQEKRAKVVAINAKESAA